MKRREYYVFTNLNVKLLPTLNRVRTDSIRSRYSNSIISNINLSFNFSESESIIVAVRFYRFRKAELRSINL